MAFDIEATVQSQYACAPHMRALIRGFWELVNPAPDIDLFYRLCFDIDTAEGVALDIWGRILGMPRDMQLVSAVGVDYFGFPNAKNTNKHALGFAQAPWYTGAQEQHLELSDDGYRLLLKTKAMANISTGSLADLNRMLAMLLPHAQVQIYRTAPMQLKMVATGTLTDYEQNLLLRGDLPPIPAGVGLEVELHEEAPFGFSGGTVRPFDQGPFKHKVKPYTPNKPKPSFPPPVGTVPFGFSGSDGLPFNQGPFVYVPYVNPYSTVFSFNGGDGVAFNQGPFINPEELLPPETTLHISSGSSLDTAAVTAAADAETAETAAPRTANTTANATADNTALTKEDSADGKHNHDH